MKPRISLVICTYNRADILPRCLSAACRQTIPLSDYQVVIVDNASTDHTRHVVKQFGGPRGLDIHYVYHPVKGLSHARNAGMAAACAPILVYIDDDAIAAPDLLWHLLRTFDSHERAACAGGRIDITLPAQLPKWYSSFFDGYYSKFDLGTTEVTKAQEIWQYPFGANIAFRSEPLRSIGGFNTTMGRIGKDYSGGEEIDAVIRLAQLGYEVFYNPAAVVRHVILPSRVHWAHIAKSALAAGKSWAYYEMELLPGKHGLKGDIWAMLATIRQMAGAVWKSPRTNFPIAYSKHLFIRSKLIRKLEYRHWTGTHQRHA
jgi:glycosyltransferase involved in cell wall biosynthesis